MRKRTSLPHRKLQYFSGERVRFALLILAGFVLLLSQGATANGVLAQATQPPTQSPPTIIKYFDNITNPAIDTIRAGQIVELKFEISNPAVNTAALTGMSFQDTLPPNIFFLTSPAAATSNTCGGTITAVNLAGGGDFKLSGGTVALASTCTITINVTASALSTYTNTTGPISAQNASESNNAGRAILSVINAFVGPMISKQFTPGTVAPNGTAVLTISVTNPNTTPTTPAGISDLKQVNFTDTLPAGLTIPGTATPNAFCGPAGSLTNTSTVITLTNGLIPVGKTCTITATVLAPATLGSYTNSIAPNAVTFNGGTNPAGGSATLIVATPPGVVKTFTTANFPSGSMGTVQFVVTNPNPAGGGNFTNFSMTDLLPTSPSPGMVVDTGGIVVTGGPGCPNVTAAAGSGSIVLSGGNLAPGNSCTIQVKVTAQTLGTYSNDTGPIKADIGGVTVTGGNSIATVDVIAPLILPPVVTKAFAAVSIPNGSSTLMTITIQNPNSTESLRGVNFIDTLPAGLIVTNPNNLNSTATCGTGRTVTANPASTTVSLSNGTIAAGTTCTITVNITGVTVQTTPPYNNIVLVKTINAGSGTDNALLTVTSGGPVGSAPLDITKSFTLSSINAGGTSLLTLTISNTANVAQFGVSVSDTLPNIPGKMVVANTAIFPAANAATTTNTCGGALTAAPNTQTISLSNGSIAAGGSCVITVVVTTPTAGTYINTTGPVSSTNIPGNNTATANLIVNGPSIAPATVQKAFTVGSILKGGTTTLTFTVVNPNVNINLINVDFSDTLPTVINTVAGSAGGTCISSFGGTLSISTQSVTAHIPNFTGNASGNSTCTFTVTVTGVQPGTGPNQTGSTTANNGGSGPGSSPVQIIKVQGPPTVNKAFLPSTTTAGGTVTLRIIIDTPNNNPFPANGVGLTDNLPILIAGNPLTQMVVANPANPTTSGSCGGGATLTATPGSSTITFANGVLTPGVPCTITVDVVAPAAGSYSNTITEVTSSDSGTGGGSNSASLQANNLPVSLSVEKSFNPLTQLVDLNSVMTIKITNPATVEQNGINFVDTFPAGLDFATGAGQPNLQNTCGGTVLPANATGGNPATLTLSGGDLLAGANCTITVNVTSALANQNYPNTVSVTSLQVTTPTTASAGLTYIGPPEPLKTITPDTITVGQTATLQIVLTNPNDLTAITGVTVTDTFPLGLTIVAFNPLPVSCGGGAGGATLTQSVNGGGQTVLKLNGGQINAGIGATCTFSVTVTAPPGQYVNTINAGQVTTTNAGNNKTPTTDDLTVKGFSVGNRIWYDNNNNGRLEAGESPAANVSVTIYPRNPDGSLGTAGATVTTDANGYYRFDGVPFGTYVISVNKSNWTGSNPLVGYASSTNNITQNGASTPDSFDNGVDPVTYTTAGVLSTPFEVGLNIMPTGEESAGGPAAGSHAGYGSSGATTDAGDPLNNLTLDFGFYRLSVGDTVWNDTGAGAAFNNGRIDAGEPGIPGVIVQLFKGGVLVAQTTTNGAGQYLFDQQTTVAGVSTGEPLLPGTDYRIVIPQGQVALNNFLSSTDVSSTTNPTATGNGVNSDDNGTGTSSANTTDTISNTFSLNVAGTLNTAGGVLLTNARTDNPTLDFGFHLAQAGTYSIGNRVWLDNGAGTVGNPGFQNNGIQDGAEVGIDNVNVLLYLNNSSNQPTTLIQSQATRNGGYYRFDAVAPGSYTVIVDVTNSPALNNLIASNFTFTDYSAAGDQRHKGSQTPLPPVGSVVPNGIPSGVIVIAAGSTQTLNELDVNAAIPAASHGPNGDASDVLTVDFGFYQPTSTLYSVGNRVFLDNGVSSPAGSANNGIQEANEPGIGGVKVNLYAADGSGDPTGGILNTATTDANGYYRMDRIPVGSYVVVVDTTPANSPALVGYAVSAVTSTDITTPGDKANKGQQTALPGVSVLPGGIRSGSFTIPPTGPIINEPDVTATGPGAHGPTTDANDILTFDFGFYIDPANAYSIGNRVFLDEGGAGARDGIQNNAETGLGAVPVVLFAADSGGNPTGAALQSTITDASSYYRFDGVTAGRYTVVVDLPTLNGGATKYQVTPVTFTSISAATDDKQNKGAQTLLGPGSPLPGGIVGPVITIPVTGNLLTGEGDVSTGQGANGPGGDTKDNLTLDFGLVTIPAGTYSIGNRVFFDNGNSGTPNDGTQQLGEPGIPSVVVKLYAAVAGDPAGAVLQTTTTDSGGYYRFDGITPGNYVVVVDVPGSAPLAGLTVSGTTTTTFTTADDQKNKGQQAALPGVSVLPGGIRSGTIAIAPTPAVNNEPDVTGAGAGAHGPNGDGNDLLTADFGFYQNPATGYSIGNRVFLDNGISSVAQPGGITGDGKQNGAEPGIPNVVVKLFYADAAGNPVGAAPIGTTTTDAGGYYRFDGFNPGRYLVVVDRAASSSLNGYTPTTPTFPTSPIDQQNNGKPPLAQGSPVPGGIPGSLVTISAGSQPSGEPDTTGVGASAHGPGTDPNDILTVDFGFIASTGSYSIGNRVWFDQYRNGVEQTNDEKGISDVRLQLWRADANGNPTTQVGSALSDADGYYRFDGLAAGDYVVIVDINASPNLKGLYSTYPMVDAQTNTADHLHNGMAKQMPDGSAVPLGISSGKISLGARPLEPLGEAVPGSYGSGSVFSVGGAPEASDDRGNLTIDFGFFLPVGGVGVADPALVKLVDPALAQPGETVNYTLTVTNNSGAAALGVIVSDPVPNTLQIVSASTPQGTYSINGQTVTFNVGTVNPGQVIVLRITARVRPDVIPPVVATNEATLTGTNLMRNVLSSATLRITRGGLPSTGEHPDEPPVSGVPLALAGVVVLAAGALVVRRRTAR